LTTTCVDANPLFDLLLVDSERKLEAQRELAQLRALGEIVLCEPVYAELAAYIGGRHALDAFLSDAEVRVVRSTSAALIDAGAAWRTYTARRRDGLECANCGRLSRPSCPQCKQPLRSRQHMIPDFIVGAHAMANGGRLLTRDRGYYRTYFPGLELV
jgi:predicted nucleic acid-binding protein